MKIAIIGPESTGKTHLARALASHYGVPWVPEYARTYVSRLGRPYTEADVEAIARRQIAEQQAHAAGGTVVFDTDLIITKVWFKHCYGRVPAFVSESLASRYFDLYLLCAPDLPWEADPVREHGDDREHFFLWYRREAEALGIPCAVVTGRGDARLQCAIEAVSKYLYIR